MHACDPSTQKDTGSTTAAGMHPLHRYVCLGSVFLGPAGFLFQPPKKRTLLLSPRSCGPPRSGALADRNSRHACPLSWAAWLASFPSQTLERTLLLRPRSCRRPRSRAQRPAQTGGGVTRAPVSRRGPRAWWQLLAQGGRNRARQVLILVLLLQCSGLGFDG